MKNIEKIILPLLITGMATIPSKCMYERQFIKGYKFETITSKTNPFQEEAVRLNRELYFCKKENITYSDCLDFSITPIDSIKSKGGLYSGKTILEQKEKFFPLRVLNKNGNYATKINLDIKSIIPSLKELSKRNNKKSFDINQYILSYILPRVKILDDKYYIINVEPQKQREKGKLPVYLVAEIKDGKEAYIEVDWKCGNTSLTGAFYRPTNEQILKKMNYVSEMPTRN